MKVLLADDDQYTRESLYRFLNIVMNVECICVSSGSDAIEFLSKESYNLIISDLKMPLINGYDLLLMIKDKHPESQVIIMSGLNDALMRQKCMDAGALDFITKPVNIEVLADYLEKLSVSQHQDKCLKPSTEVILPAIKHKGIEPIGYFSVEMKKILDFVEILKEEEDVPVLIEGETGTGKEIIAKMFQRKNQRSPFVSINCSAISPSLFESELFGYEEGSFTGAQRKGKAGKFEQAQNGVLFLDEIGDLPYDMQPKLLRVIQEKEVSRIGSCRTIPLNLRIVCATNKNLEQEVMAGRFRSDLYYRLNTGYLHIKPLRQRTDDIEPLSRMFMEYFAYKRKKQFKEITKDALMLLKSYQWPGNIRELKNTIDRITLLHNDSLLKSMYLPFIKDKTFKESNKSEQIILTLNLRKDNHPLEEIEKEVISKILNYFEGNITQSADYLSISRNRIKRKM